MSVTKATEDISWVSFPLPFQIFSLIGVAVLGWATNLHVLDLIGIDVISLLDLRTDVPSSLPAHNRNPRPTRALAALYIAIYRLFLAYSLLCFMAWSTYRYSTHGDVRLVDLFGYIPCIAAVSILLILFCPFNVLHKTERRKFILATRRCVVPSGGDPIYFSDVILADIFTSFAQVIGDVWLSLCMLLPGHSILHPTAGVGLARWILPTVMSFPYLIRFRQCIIENKHAAGTTRRPLYNAVKYATAFPVIYLSAAQPRSSDSSDAKAVDNAWHGERQIFRIWLLAALVHSLYSFWWDATNDWGFDFLKVPFEEKQTHASPSRAFFERDEHLDPPTSQKEKRHRHPYGLRSGLHFPTFAYCFLIALNLILRLTWSMKLFSVVNVKSHTTIVNFGLKLAELFRRWLWVFVRVEWEQVKKDHEGQGKTRAEEPAYELIPRGTVGPQHEE